MMTPIMGVVRVHQKRHVSKIPLRAVHTITSQLCRHNARNDIVVSSRKDAQGKGLKTQTFS